MIKIMKTKKYNQGSTALWIIILALIIIVGGGAYYYFSKSNSSQNAGQLPVSSGDINPNSQGNDNSNANNTITPTPQQTTAFGIGNACDYLTQDIVNQYLGDKYAKGEDTSAKNPYAKWGCGYSFWNGVTTLAVSFSIAALAVQQYDQTQIDKLDKIAISNGATEVSGIGNKAWLYNKSSTNDNASLQFFKSKRLYTLGVNAGTSYEDNATKAESIAKAIVQKLP